MGKDDAVNFILISYNINSAMSAARLEALVDELDELEWDVVQLSETWRAERHEDIVLDSCHRFFGSGGYRRSCGVGFLINKRHDNVSFTSINARSAALHWIAGRHRLCIFSVYFPDSVRPDEHVDSVYEQLHDHIQWCRRKRFSCIIAGDFNARVGQRDEYADQSILGSHAYPGRNCRGEWLLQWCTTHKLALANTFFDQGDDAWTYRNGSLRTQIDYILVDCSLFSSLRSCNVFPDVDTGSCHRPVRAQLCFGNSSGARKGKAKRKRSAWHVDHEKYKFELDLLVEGVAGQGPADGREQALTQAMLRATELSQKARASNRVSQDSFTPEIQTLINERRALQRRQDILRRREICKRIQALVRKRMRERKQSKIRAILSDFRGLKDIFAIRGAGVKQGIKCIKDKDGIIKESGEEIAEVFCQFYEALYQRRTGPHETGTDTSDSCNVEMQPVAMDELDGALRGMRRGRAADEAGVIAEMVKDCSSNLLQAILVLFDDVMQLRMAAPSSWKSTKLIVISKRAIPVWSRVTDLYRSCRCCISCSLVFCAPGSPSSS